MEVAGDVADHVLGDAIAESNPRRVESADEVLGIIEAAW